MLSKLYATIPVITLMTNSYPGKGLEKPDGLAWYPIAALGSVFFKRPAENTVD